MCEKGCCNLNSNERNELESLRKEIKILKDLCLPDKFYDVWCYGLSSGIFSGRLLTSELKEELWKEDLESILQDELNSLDKEYDGIKDEQENDN